VAAHTKAKLQRSILQSKSWMWTDYLLKIRGGSAWREVKFANPDVGAPEDALTNTHGGEANTMAEKEEMLRGDTFLLHDAD
jgi:hypothetical protein